MLVVLYVVILDAYRFVNYRRFNDAFYARIINGEIDAMK